jgi:hypothetical protein
MVFLGPPVPVVLVSPGIQPSFLSTSALFYMNEEIAPVSLDGGDLSSRIGKNMAT